MEHEHLTVQDRCCNLMASKGLLGYRENLNQIPDPKSHLKELHGENTRLMRFQMVKELFRSPMVEGSSVRDHGLRMIELIGKLRQLGVAMDEEFCIDLILQSLSSSFDTFVIMFNMQKGRSTLPELFNLLVTYESTLKKTTLGMGSSSSDKKTMGGSTKNKSSKLKGKGGIKKADAASKGICFHCNKPGHWKRNCNVYLAELKLKRSVLGNDTKQVAE